jgi:hypothetical protein
MMTTNIENKTVPVSVGEIITLSYVPVIIDYTSTNNFILRNGPVESSMSLSHIDHIVMMTDRDDEGFDDDCNSPSTTMSRIEQSLCKSSISTLKTYKTMTETTLSYSFNDKEMSLNQSRSNIISEHTYQQRSVDTIQCEYDNSCTKNVYSFTSQNSLRSTSMYLVGSFIDNNQIHSSNSCIITQSSYQTSKMTIGPTTTSIPATMDTATTQFPTKDRMESNDAKTVFVSADVSSQEPKDDLNHPNGHNDIDNVDYCYTGSIYLPVNDIQFPSKENMEQNEFDADCDCNDDASTSSSDDDEDENDSESDEDLLIRMRLATSSSYTVPFASMEPMTHSSASATMEPMLGMEEAIIDDNATNVDRTIFNSELNNDDSSSCSSSSDITDKNKYNFSKVVNFSSTDNLSKDGTTLRHSVATTADCSDSDNDTSSNNESNSDAIDDSDNSNNLDCFNDHDYVIREVLTSDDSAESVVPVPSAFLVQPTIKSCFKQSKLDTPKPKSVVFHKEIVSSIEYLNLLKDIPKDVVADVWWSHEEMLQLRQEYEGLLYMIDQEIPINDLLESARGLEIRTEDGEWKFYEHKRDAWNAVLGVQDDYMNKKKPENYHILISDAYLDEGKAHKTREEAFQRAANDFQAIQEYVGVTDDFKK